MEQAANGLFPPSLGTTSSSTAAVKLNRTCQACRIRKIRCVYDSSIGQCQRCSKLSLSCLFEPPAIRKKRERNETRIRDLERKIEGLQAAVARGHSADVSSPGESAPSTDLDHHSQATLDDSAGDPIAQGLVTPAEAGELYRVFHDQYAPLYPLVSPPPPQLWGHVRAESPALFRAALTTASSSVKPELWEVLFDDTKRYLVHEVMILGNRSLQLIQAATILATWNHPPNKFQKLTFNHTINMAATIVIDLRLSNEPQYKIPPAGDGLEAPSEQLLELGRTFLATYFLCSSVAMSFRRPSVLRYGSWVEDCLHVLDSVPNPSPNDQMLVAWCRLHRLAEESLTIVGLEEKPHIDISDTRNRFIIERCIEQVTRWKQSTPPVLVNGAMEIHYHMVLLVLYEPALYGSHKLDDFRPPYKISKTAPPSSESVHVREQCISAAQGVLSIFLAYDDQDLRRVPVILYVRMMHAVVVLVKLEAPTAMADIDRLVQKLESASHMRAFHIPRLFHFVLLQVSSWRRNQSSGHGENGAIEPLLGINDEKRRGQREAAQASDGVQYQGVDDNGNMLFSPESQVQSSITAPEWDKLPDNCLASEALPDEVAMAFLDQIFGNGPVSFIANSWS